jgi:dTMP kinase
MLKAGIIVLCDRYIYTALARGYARGIEIEHLRHFYDQYFPIPDMTFYFRLPVEAGMKRAAGRSHFRHVLSMPTTDSHSQKICTHSML